MKLSILTNGYTHFFIRDLGELIDYHADLGYGALDLSMGCPYDSFLLDEDNWLMPTKRIKQRMESRNMFFCQAHSPIVTYLDEANEEDERKLRQCIKVCSYLGIKSLVVHLLHVKGCTPESFVEKNVEYYNRFLPMLDDYDVDFCFENYGHFLEKDSYCFDADQLLAVINAMDSTHIHACWDTGHANLTRLNQYNEVTKLGDHLRAVHIHDNHYPIKEPDGMFCPDAHNFPLFGNINFDAFMQALIDIDYKNAFSIETDTPNRKGHEDFFYNGELTLNLKPIPFRIREMADKMLFEIGKYMLETYGLWENN
ncbi:MAG: sugar phosphate isomerase/epimerase [Clostridiales bacterium]|nr:sugar phosphate isomerase/epimerase [Clostridiales bacterium]